MSICRTGEDSDVYAYRTSDGIELHVAARRSKIKDSMSNAEKEQVQRDIETISPEDFEKKYSEKLDSVYAGRSFYFRTTEELRGVLSALRVHGIRVPDRLMGCEIK